MKYVNANLQSYKEFIQRMLNGEVFCHQIDTDIRYLYDETGFCLDKHGEKSVFDPFKTGYWNACIKIEEIIEESIAAKPRLCWVSYYDDFRTKFVVVIVGKRSDYFEDMHGNVWSFVKLVELNEIKQYLGDDNE